jgi:hypothetical protein
MTTFERFVILGLASIHSEQNGLAVEEVLAKWIETAEVMWPETKTKRSSSADVEEIYAAYPSKDANNGGRPLGKGQKDKATIKALLTEGGYSKDELLQLIKQEVTARQDTGAYLRNFSTFLHNLPDLEDGTLL